MTDLPARYAALVAKRPELAVPQLRYYETSNCWYRVYVETPSRLLYKDESEALICWHWTKMMPPTCCLRHNLDDPPLWTCGNVCNEHGKVSASDPLSALFAYWEAQ